MLFALRFESQASNGIRTLLSQLRKRGGETESRRVQNLQRYAGINARKGNLFGDELSSTRNITGKLFKGLKGVENVYTQHQPLLRQILEDLIKGKLRSNLFPCLGSPHEGRVTNILVFVIGGITYEEAYTVHQLNSSLKVQILLGGTSILNSQSFLQQVDQSFPQN